jgi:hypothetical protein
MFQHGSLFDALQTDANPEPVAQCIYINTESLAHMYLFALHSFSYQESHLPFFSFLNGPLINNGLLVSSDRNGVRPQWQL